MYGCVKNVEVNAPIKIGDVIVENILDTGIDIVSCRNLKKRNN